MLQRGVRLPNFLVIGAARSGTTSLYHYLAQHPQIFMSPVKEPRFFALEGHPLDFRGPGDERLRADTITSFDRYQELFAGAGDEIAVGEASTVYLSHKAAPDAIARYLPGVRLIALLRDPAERAHSAFQHLIRDGWEPLTDFGEALRDEPRRIADGWYDFWHYRERGFYYRQLSRYFDRFGADRIRIFLYEDFVQNPLVVLEDIYRFLGVETEFRADVSARHNASGRARSAGMQRFLTGRHPLKEAARKLIPERLGHRVISLLQRENLTTSSIPPETRAWLVEGYRDDTQRLEELIGRDLSAWQK